METLHKNIFKQPFFWTSVCSLLAVGIIVGLYSYAWVAPTASPNSNAGSAINFSGGNVGIGTVSPSSKLDVVGNVGIRTGNGLRLYNPANTDYVTISLDGVNVVQANYPWNFYGTGDHTISGSVGIGIADPVEKLEVAGNIKMTGMGNGIKFPDGTSQTTAASGGSGTITAIPSGTTGTYSLNWNALQICQFGTCCPPWKDCDSDTKTYEAATDCDEGCATCYVGSGAYTNAPDGKDQNCDGIVDNDLNWNIGYALFVTNTTYIGNVGGRSGADTKCNSDVNKPSGCVGNAWAMMSFTSADEIQDMPSTKSVNTSLGWSWVKGSSEAAAFPNWNTLITGTMRRVSGTVGYYGYRWHFSDYNGVLHTMSCLGGTYTGTSYNGAVNHGSTVSLMQPAAATQCSSANYYPLLCACSRPSTINEFQ